MITDDEQWLPISQAAVVLGVSERTVRNYITAGKIPVHKDRGRTYVDVAAMRRTQQALGANQNSDTTPQADPAADPDQENNLMKIIGAELALRGQAQDMMVRADREVDHLRQDLKGARRSGRLAWASAAGLLIAAGVAASWATGRFTRLDQQFEQAISAVDSANHELLDREQKIDQLENRITALADSLQTEHAKLTETLTSHALENQARAQAAAEAAAKIEMLTATLTDLKRSLDTFQEKNDSLAQELRAERVKVALSLESKVRLREQYLEDRLKADQRIMELESTLAKAEEKLTALTAPQAPGRPARGTLGKIAGAAPQPGRQTQSKPDSQASDSPTSQPQTTPNAVASTEHDEPDDPTP